jgi:hypothetical protein
VVAACADRPGVEEALGAAEALAREGTRVGVLFTEDGIDLAGGDWPARLRAAGARPAVCGRSVRGRRTDPAALPPDVEWTSLTAFLREVPDGARLWSVFP